MTGQPQEKQKVHANAAGSVFPVVYVLLKLDPVRAENVSYLACFPCAFAAFSIEGPAAARS
jgi:hypothetical protein